MKKNLLNTIYNEFWDNFKLIDKLRYLLVSL